MANKTSVGQIFPLLLLVVTGGALAATMRGWDFSSSSPQSYSAGVDKEVFHSGKASGFLRSVGPVSRRHYGILTQSIRADNFVGRQIKMTGYVRTVEVKGWAGMWLRVDPLNGPALEFDNMEKRPIVATTAWTAYEITLEVPPEAYSLHYGILLQGSGQVWLDDVNFSKIGDALPASKARRKVRDDTLPLDPLNLGFED